ncbi:MAG: NAD-binding protein [Gaiellaceae bacterium]
MRRQRRSKLVSAWDAIEWPAVALLALTALGLGIEGFHRQLPDLGAGDIVYRALQLFTLESGSLEPPIVWELDIARFLAPAVAVYAAASALAAVFQEQLQLLRTRLWRGHVVIVGLGERGRLLAAGFKERGDKVLAVERDAENDAVARCRDLGIPVLIGDATDEDVLLKSRVQHARYLVAVGSHDGVNAEVAVDAGGLVAVTRDADQFAYVHLVDRRLCELVRESRAGRGTHGAFKLRFFNVYESGARVWLAEHPPFHLDDDDPHLVVAGVGEIGTSLVLGAVRQWLALHPETALRGEPGPRITLVDRAANTKRERLHVRKPLLKRFVRLEAAELEFDSPEFERADFLADGASTVFVCLDDDATSLKAALTMLRRLRGRNVPVVVRMRQEAGLSLLRAHEAPNLHAFHLLDRVCTPEALLGLTRTEVLARTGHEEYVREAESRGHTPETNPSMVPWDDLTEELRESNRRQQDHALVKLRAIGCEIAPLEGSPDALVEFSEDEVELMAELEHDRWLAERLFEGWTRAPGPKDPERRTHPDIVPFHELADEVKELDRMVVRRLPELFAAGGYRIRRL